MDIYVYIHICIYLKEFLIRNTNTKVNTDFLFPNTTTNNNDNNNNNNTS